MAQTLSTAVSNRDAITRVIGDSITSSTNVLTTKDTVTVPDTAASDTIIMKPMPVDAVVQTLEVTVDDLGTTGTIDIGLFKKVETSGVVTYVVVDADCIANNLDVTLAASSALAPQRFAGLSADAIDKTLWEVAGLSAKPDYPEFFIGLTTDTGTTAAGVFTYVCTYTI